MSHAQQAPIRGRAYPYAALKALTASGCAIALCGIIAGCSSDSNDDNSTTIVTSTSTSTATPSEQKSPAPSEDNGAGPSIPPSSAADPSDASQSGAANDNALLNAVVGSDKKNTNVRDVRGAGTTKELGEPALASGMPFYSPGVQFTRNGKTMTVCSRGNDAAIKKGIEQVAALDGTSCEFASAAAGEAFNKVSGSKKLSQMTPLSITATSPVSNEKITLNCESQADVTACESKGGASILMW
ncbi:hypothetical protein [uncultured Corynebacterium sp.]|uniref:hypothetical protein n=1 Tax=uncultured Corynebacterium sp. TaxID=159447 RepID=UPI0025DCBE96|nr:hypothetical protein [uncultured Corynebacterium sp.]